MFFSTRQKFLLHGRIANGVLTSCGHNNKESLIACFVLLSSGSDHWFVLLKNRSKNRSDLSSFHLLWTLEGLGNVCLSSNLAILSQKR